MSGLGWSIHTVLQATDRVCLPQSPTRTKSTSKWKKRSSNVSFNLCSLRKCSLAYYTKSVSLAQGYLFLEPKNAGFRSLSPGVMQIWSREAIFYAFDPWSLPYIFDPTGRLLEGGRWFKSSVRWSVIRQISLNRENIYFTFQELNALYLYPAL